MAGYKMQLNENPIVWTPELIGTFSSPMKNRYDAPRQASLETHQGTIRLNKKQNFEQALKDLEGMERIWIIYLFHLNQSHWKPMVNPPRNPEGIKRGVFATRAPYRPNPIGMSCVKIESIRGLNITVSESDLLDGTPILDIKPYIPYADSFPDSKIGWLEDMEASAYDIKWKDSALSQSLWLESKGLMSFEAYVRKQLEYQPLSTRHKRVRLLKEQCYSLGYRTWRIAFELDLANKTIFVKDIFSGYREDELKDFTDKYQDKEIHLQYIQRFGNHQYPSELRL